MEGMMDDGNSICLLMVTFCIGVWFEPFLFLSIVWTAPARVFLGRYDFFLRYIFDEVGYGLWLMDFSLDCGLRQLT